jgi:hypothetical protein
MINNWNFNYPSSNNKLIFIDDYLHYPLSNQEIASNQNILLADYFAKNNIKEEYDYGL